jgi:ribonucleoside-diphosphate reductase beta chain
MEHQKNNNEKNNNEKNIEPILIPDKKRFTVFPILYTDIWEYYLTHKKAFWIAESVDISNDLKDWKLLNNDEKYFIKHILAFFAAADGIVMENLVERFLNEVQWAEVRQFYSFQLNIEAEHNLMYSLLIDTYISNENEKQKLFNSIETMPSIALKGKWAEKWINSTDSFATRLIAFAIVEGIFFSGAFCSIYWIMKKKLMPGLTESNSYIARDENLHCMFAVLLYNKYIVNKLPENTIHNIVKEAVDIEKNFIVDALPCSLIGMNSKLMTQYIQFCADRLVSQLNYNKIYYVNNPFPWMDDICLTSHVNFFDNRSSDYRKNISQEKNEDKIISFDEDF